MRDGRGARPDGRTGELVGRERLVDVDLDAGLGGLVQLSAQGTIGLRGTRAGDLEVKALRVILGTVLHFGTVQSHQLVTEDIVTRSDGLGNFDHPAVVVLDQLVITPGTRNIRVVHQANAVDLEELERGLVNRFAALTAVGQIVHDGTVVRVGPFGPLNVDAVTCLHSNVALGVRRVLVADNVGRGVIFRADEAVAGVGSGPSGDNRRIGHVRERGDVKAFVRDTVDNDVGDMAVGSHLGGRQQRGQERCRLKTIHSFNE